MKKRYIFIVAMLLGFCSIMVRNNYRDGINLSSIVLKMSLSNIQPDVAYLSEITKWFIPLLVFQVLGGAYIYQHFYSASVYFFSRNINRKKWFTNEGIKLFAISIAYVSILFIMGVISARISCNIIYDRPGILLATYYVIIYSLYLFAATMAINIISMKYGSSIGFAIVMSINILGIVAYAFTENILSFWEGVSWHYDWLFKANIIAQLSFSTHSSKYASLDKIINVYDTKIDFDHTIIELAIISIILLLVGSKLCEKHEFIKNNIEE